MEGRMTLCNMAIEGGARAGLVAVDAKTIAYVKGRPFAPKPEHWGAAVAYWQTRKSDPGASFDKTVEIDATTFQPQVSWGTSPEMVLPVGGQVPNPATERDPAQRPAHRRVGHGGVNQ